MENADAKAAGPPLEIKAKRGGMKNGEGFSPASALSKKPLADRKTRACAFPSSSTSRDNDSQLFRREHASFCSKFLAGARYDCPILRRSIQTGNNAPVGGAKTGREL